MTQLVWFSLFARKAIVKGSVAEEAEDRGLGLLGVYSLLCYWAM